MVREQLDRETCATCLDEAKGDYSQNYHQADSMRTRRANQGASSDLKSGSLVV